MHRRLIRTDTIRSGVTPHRRSSDSPSNLAGRVRRARALLEEAEALIARGEQLIEAAVALLTDVGDRTRDDGAGEPSPRRDHGTDRPPG